MEKIQPNNLSPKKITSLHSLHHELGGKFVTFAGYEMPLQYKTGIIAEHLHVRNQAGLFDISHMGQIKLAGTDAAVGLETLVPSNIIGLSPFRQRYTLFTNNSGGIIDDLIVTNLESELHLVVNAACKDTDYHHICENIASYADIEMLSDWSLLALQGPLAREVLSRITPATLQLDFMSVVQTKIAGSPCLISCSGYTGEDGFEISVHSDEVEELARLLLNQPEVIPIGLGARDSLRLEAGLCLYGHDLDLQTTPVEAGLAWVINASRRMGGERSGGYPGAKKIDGQLTNGPDQLRIGLLPEGKIPVREGSVLLDEYEQEVGRITSGGYSPTLERPIAMGYVTSNLARTNVQLNSIVRNKTVPMNITDIPFLPANRPG